MVSNRIAHPNVVYPLVSVIREAEIVRYFSVWGLITRPEQKKIDETLHDLTLLSRNEFAALFPGCKMREEKVLGLTKSFIVERI